MGPPVDSQVAVSKSGFIYGRYNERSYSWGLLFHVFFEPTTISGKRPIEIHEIP